MEVRTNETISVTDIQRRAKEIFERIERGEQDRFVVLKNNEIAAVLLSSDRYEALMDELEDLRIDAIAAERMVLLTDVEGVLDREGKLISHLTVSEAKALIADGTISGGMIPKVNTAIDAVQQGVKAAVILDGRIPHVLLLELFTEIGAGTLIKAD